ncbi:hypothetical protein JCM3770_004163 [Rhodotorula araucariae]
MIAFLVRAGRHVGARALRLAVRDTRSTLNSIAKVSHSFFVLPLTYCLKPTTRPSSPSSSVLAASILPIAIARSVTPVETAGARRALPARTGSPPTPTLSTGSASPFFSTPLVTPASADLPISPQHEPKHQVPDLLATPPSIAIATPDLVRDNVAKYVRVKHLKAPCVEHNQGMVDFARFEELAEDEVFLAQCIPYATRDYSFGCEPAPKTPLELLQAQVGAGEGGALPSPSRRAVADYPLPPALASSTNSFFRHKIPLTRLATFPGAARGELVDRLSPSPSSSSSSSSAWSELWGTAYEMSSPSRPRNSAPLKGEFPAFCLDARQLSLVSDSSEALPSLLPAFILDSSPFAGASTGGAGPSPRRVPSFPAASQVHKCTPPLAPCTGRRKGRLSRTYGEALAFPSPPPTPPYGRTPPLQVRIAIGAPHMGGVKPYEFAQPTEEGPDFRWTYGMV